MFIYKITNKISGKSYIGQTVRSVEERFREHCRHSNTYIDKAIKKHGKNNFVVETICETDNIDELNRLEIYYIEFYDTFKNGYNLCVGGENTLGFKHREESKKKMSKSKTKDYAGENNPFYGKKHSEESRKKMSASRMGRIINDEWKAKLAKAHYVKVVNLTTGEKFESVKLAAESVNAPATHITRACKGKRKSCRGFEWAYDNTVPSLDESL